MIAVDTNILVRYITGDDEKQSMIAAELLETYSNQEKSIFINNIVLCELIWVLTRGYKYKKSEIVKTLKLLLSAIEFEFESHKLTFLAAAEYERSDADFSDILIGLTNNFCGVKTTYSFDQNSLKLKYFTGV